MSGLHLIPLCRCVNTVPSKNPAGGLAPLLNAYTVTAANEEAQCNK